MNVNWKDLGKKTAIAGGVVLFVWAVFIANLGYQSVAMHMVDVWKSRVMQEKRDLVTDEVKQLFNGSLIKVKKEKDKLARQRGTQKKSRHKNISDGDRKTLDSLIDKSFE